MMGLTEREKEIAIELGIPTDKADAFLSRIREEQEAYATLQRGSNHVIECIYKGMLTPINVHSLLAQDQIDRYTSIKLFTTLPSAPDCSELVEALEKIADTAPGEGSHRHIALTALANHAKRMKG